MPLLGEQGLRMRANAVHGGGFADLAAQATLIDVFHRDLLQIKAGFGACLLRFVGDNRREELAGEDLRQFGGRLRHMAVGIGIPDFDGDDFLADQLGGSLLDTDGKISRLKPIERCR